MGEKKHYEGYVTDIITDKALEFLQKRRDPDKPFFLMFHHKAPHRSWQPGPDYLTLYDGRDIPEPDTLFDDYQGRGTAAKEQEMMVAKHLSDMNDLKLTPDGDPGAGRGLESHIPEPFHPGTAQEVAGGLRAEE